MRALITNDDGTGSPGLVSLASVAVDADLEVVVAAPHLERSGSGASLGALRNDGRLVFREEPLLGLPEAESFGVEATPAFIVWATARGAFGGRPDIVLSGINNGPNAGNAILHSGTVGAALTAVAHGIPALAVSMSTPNPSHWETGAHVASETLAWLLGHDLSDAVVLNVNVPDVPVGELRGLKAAPLADFGAVQVDVAEIGRGYVTITFSEVDISREPESDAGMQAQGWATVTPLVGPREVLGFGLAGLVD